MESKQGLVADLPVTTSLSKGHLLNLWAGRNYGMIYVNMYN